MAKESQRARERAIAVEELRASVARLADRFGVEAPEIPARYPKDPTHLATLQLRAVTAFLDSLEGATNDPVADADANGEQSPAPPDDAPSESDNAMELDKLTRAELDVYATALGIEGADKLPNKDAVLAAIKAAS